MPLPRGPLPAWWQLHRQQALSLVDPTGWSHDWRRGGPMLLAEPAQRGPHVLAGDMPDDDREPGIAPKIFA
jgi:hypothetical protein